MPKRRNIQKRNRRSPAVSRVLKPPTIRPNIQVVHKYRFYSDSSNSATITNQQLLTAAGCMVTTNNTTATSMWMSVRIISIEIWSIPSTSATSSCKVEWKGDSSLAGIQQQEISDTSLSPNIPAHIIARPSRGTIPAMWHQGGFSQNLFTVSVDNKGIVDVTLQLILRDAPTSSNATIAIASGSLGTAIYAPLDGSGDKFLPAGLTTTT